MKILLVNKRYGYEGGIEQYLQWVAQELTRQGHEVWFLCAERDGLASYVPDERVLMIPALLPEVLDVAPAVKKDLSEKLKRVSPDLIYLHHLRNPAWLRTLADHGPIVRFAHMEDVICPLIEKSFLPAWEPCLYKTGKVTCGMLCPYFHRYGSRHPKYVLERLRYQDHLRRENGRVRHWIVASEYMRASLIREGYPESQVHLIPYFVHLPETMVEPPRSPRNILFSGRLVEPKGVAYLLRAFAKLPSDVMLGIAGDGQEKKKLEALASELRVADRVRFFGRVPNEEIGKLRNEARLIVVPSLFQEPFGIVGIEAMAYARPVVGHRVGGIPDWLLDGKTGYLVESKDVDALVARMKEFIDSPELATEFGRAGRKRAEEFYVPERHMARLMEVLRLVV